MSRPRPPHPPSSHRPRRSIDSNVESTISFSAFPAPPTSIPSTPTASEFHIPSPVRSNSRPLPPSPLTTAPSLQSQIPRYGGPTEPNSGQLHRDHTSVSAQGPSSSHSVDSPTLPYTRRLSPYDWHEGASSIDVDATEDRLLSTSFITSLLQESSRSSRKDGRRNSIASDAFSGLSEMTYPPGARFSEDHLMLNSSSSTGPRHAGNRPRGAFSPIPESPSGHISDDSATLYQDYGQPGVVRSASYTHGLTVQGASVVGLSPATLQRVSQPSSANLNSNERVYSANQDEINKLAAGEYNVLDVPLMSPALPSTAGTQLHFRKSVTRAPNTRQSIHSTKSFAPSFVSNLSSVARSITRAIPWRKKPLPPVPIIPHIPLSMEVAHREAEADMPLPDLAARAGTLGTMLEKGYHPHRSLNSVYLTKDERLMSISDHTEDPYRRSPFPHSPSPHPTQHLTPVPWISPEPWNNLLEDPPKHKKPRKKVLIISLCSFSILALAAIGAAVGVTLSRRGPNLPQCAEGLTGAACDLNSTCICTSTSSLCGGLAQSILDLRPTMNDLFDTNHTANDVYNAIWSAQGSPASSSCAAQALLVDVAPALSQVSFPNRTKWAQSALLWNLVQSQDVTATKTLQAFIAAAPWSTLTTDGPAVDNATSFSVSASGFIFNFASQIVSQLDISFVADSQPTTDQISRVGDVARSALNRMYSFAKASATQQQSSLSTYWTTVLQQRIDDLPFFLSTFSSSPVLLPFDATSDSISNLLASATKPFPPALACYPNLNSSSLERVNSLEVNVFGLPSASVATNFDSSCYPARPIYGVLDVLQLRLPFVDSHTSAPKQAVVINKDVKPRVVAYTGERLSSLLQSFPTTTTTANPRNFGTLNHMQHIVLEYLKSFPSTTAAMAFVARILSSELTPPTVGSPLLESIDSIPVIEVAVFGTVQPEDITSIVSSFSTPSGSLFFGSSTSALLRNWTIADNGKAILWAENATAPLIAKDGSMTDALFNQILSTASTAIEQHAENVGVANVTKALGDTGKLTVL